MTSRAIVGAILCALAGIAAADTLESRIVGVADGDTLTLLDGDNRQHRIRLDGVGLEQITRGMAWHFKRYEREQSAADRAAYAAAEVEARQARRGLWRDPHPVPPWQWRSERR